MDLIVHTAGGSIQSVSGVNETTTCAQIVYALAHATRQKGRFSLVANLDGFSPQSRRFSPNDHPYLFVREWSQQGVSVEFELIKLEDEEQRDEGDREKSDTPNGLNGFSTSSSATLNEFSHNSRESVDRTRNRPPPPDYNAVIAERCNSLRRQIPVAKKVPSQFTFLNIPNFSLQDLHSRNFSRQDLEALIEIQERTLAAQKGELVRVELNMLDSSERELVQLRKQHNNLQTVLNSLRNGDWPAKVEAEQAEAERLHTAIAAMRTAIAEKRRELQEAVQLKMTLDRQLTNELNRAEKENDIHVEEREL